MKLLSIKNGRRAGGVPPIAIAAGPLAPGRAHVGRRRGQGHLSRRPGKCINGAAGALGTDKTSRAAHTEGPTPGGGSAAVGRARLPETLVGPGPTAPRSLAVASRWAAGATLLVAYYLLLAAIAGYLVIAGPLDTGTKVTRTELGPAWPLTIPEGTLRCEVGKEITLHYRGTGYSLTSHDDHGAYSDIARIRADNPAGGKMDLSPLIERGQRLCD